MFPYDIAIFDCDGVILDSNKIKTEAFRSALDNEPSDLVDTFIVYHQEHGGVSRYIKFKYYFTNIKKVYNEQEISNALEKYANIVRQELLVCSMVQGVKQYLELLNTNGIPCYVNTGSDEKELIEIFEERSLSKSFCKILGSPSNKIENIMRIESKIKDKKVIYFGDAKMDWTVANKFDFKFIFISGLSEWIDGTETAHLENFDIYEDFNSFIGINK